MQSTTVHPPQHWGVIVAGTDVATARDAVAHWTGSAPMDSVGISTVAVHARVWADAAQMSAWFDAGTANRRANAGAPTPGDLCFFHAP